MQSTSKNLRLFSAVCAAALLAACGGHSGGIVPPAKTTGGSGMGGNARATLTVKIPKKAAASRRPAYISAGTQSISFAYAIGTTQYPAQTLNVTPSSPGCAADTSGNTVCTLTFGAFAGSATYTVSAYDGQNGTGNLLASAQSSMSIVAGQDNAFNITLDGTPKTMKIGPETASVTSGTPSSVAVTISAYDADGNLIVNSPAFWSATLGASYDTATLKSSDTSEFTVTQNGTTLPTASGDASAYQLTMPFTNLAVQYSGTGRSVGTLTLSTPETGLSDALTISVQAPPPTVTEYSVPWGNNGTQPKPWGIAADSSGNVWFTDDQVDLTTDNGRIGTVSASGSFTMYGVHGYLNQGIALGPDGNFWLTGECGPGGIDVYSTGGTFIANYQLPSASTLCATGGGQIVSGAGGNLWFTEGDQNRIGQITTTGTATEYSLGSSAQSITMGPDGNMWFTETSAGKIGEITAAGSITEYALPSGTTPRNIASGIDGNLWFTETLNGVPTIGKMTTAGAYTAYKVPYTETDPYYYGPGSIIAGPDGGVWFGDEGHLDRIDTSTGTITDYPATFACGANEIPRAFTAVNSTTMWFTDGDGCVGKIVIN